MTLADEPTTAEMDPWLLVEVRGEECLFGFAKRHAKTGGLSWTLSTPIVELDETTVLARTKSGRIYALGRHITLDELDEESSLALRLLLAKWTKQEPPPNSDLLWLTARKMARHLRVDPPPRDAPSAVWEFLTTYRELYAARRAGRRPN